MSRPLTVPLLALAACTASTSATPPDRSRLSPAEPGDTDVSVADPPVDEDPEAARLARVAECIRMLDQVEFTSGWRLPERSIRDGVLWLPLTGVLPSLMMEMSIPPTSDSPIRGPRVGLVLRRLADNLQISTANTFAPVRELKGKVPFGSGVDQDLWTLWHESGQSVCEPQMILDIDLTFDPWESPALEDLRECNRRFTFPVKLAEEEGRCYWRYRPDIPRVPIADGWTPPPFPDDPTPWTPPAPPVPPSDSADTSR